MIGKTTNTALLLAFLLILTAQPVHADSGPMETLKAPLDRVVGILKDPKYDSEAKLVQQREELLVIAFEVFDFIEVSRRTLGRNWRIFSPQERKDFTDVFSDFLANVYLDRIQSEYHDENVTYVGEEMQAEGRAVVKTSIQRDGVQVPVEYSMHLTPEGWRIYDVNIEGVGLIQNYRSQFNRILMNESPAQLIERLQTRQGVEA